MLTAEIHRTPYLERQRGVRRLEKRERELRRLRHRYMKRRRERARRGKYLAILACAGLASACLFLAWTAESRFCLCHGSGRWNSAWNGKTEPVKKRTEGGERKERADGRGEEEEQEKGRTRTRFGIVFRLEDGELILYRERQEAE